MTVVRLVFQQHGAPATPLSPAAANAPVSSDIGEMVRQATQAALEGTHAAQAATGTGDIRIVRNGQTITIPRLPILEPGAQTFSTSPADFIPQQAVEMAWGFFAMLAVMVVGLPIARAFGRRIDRRGEDVGAATPALSSQLVRIEQAVEAMSIEVERISESQRFMAKLQQGSTAERV
jgi:hypothetical protein